MANLKIRTVLAGLVACATLAAAAWVLLKNQAEGQMQKLIVTVERLPAIQLDVPCSIHLTATGGIPPYRWTLTGGSLPAGVTMGGNGLIEGIPSEPGVFSFTVRVHDKARATDSVTLDLTVEGGAAQLPDDVLWRADFETGDTRQWYLPSTGEWGDHGGGIFASGVAYAAVSPVRARTGNYGLEMVIQTPPESGIRLFRWREPQRYPELYYRAWYFIPEQYRVAEYWNVWQWKSKRTNGSTDPFFIVNVGNRKDGSMYLYLYDWQSRRSYLQEGVNVPVGKWFQVQTMYVCAGDRTGKFSLWQDGDLLFELTGIQTRYADGDCQWSVNSYSSRLIPSPARLYVDDISIAKSRWPVGEASAAAASPAGERQE